MFQDKPVICPKTCPDGKAVKPLTQALLDRRATPHFKPDAVPEEYLETILRFGTQAPSGYNIQPWRFVVVRDKANRERLKAAAYNQEKVGEAPVMIIAFAIRDDWKNHIDAIFAESVRRGYGKPETVGTAKQNASEFLEKGISQEVWLNRHTMIAVTAMMLVAETYGLDTAPMEGFDPAAVGREFGLPQNAEVIALLAVGFAREPDKPYAGRFDLSQIVFDEHYGKPWTSRWNDANHSSQSMFQQIERKANEPVTAGK